MEYQFKPFQRVLVRDSEKYNWKLDMYSHLEDCVDSGKHYYACIGGFFNLCIPYAGNEKLLGTANNPEPVHEYKWGDKVRVKVDGRVGVIVSEDIGKMVNVLLKGYRDAFVVCSLDEIEPCKDD